jgi:hypothetical protein
MPVPETAGIRHRGPYAWLYATGNVRTAQIVLTNGLGGTQLGLWFSCGQLRDQLVDDDADTHSLAARAVPAVEECAIAQRVAAIFTGAAAWHGHRISGHCTSWGSHNYGVMCIVPQNTSWNELFSWPHHQVLPPRPGLSQPKPLSRSFVRLDVTAEDALRGDSADTERCRMVMADSRETNMRESNTRG